jgi:hypothetical protein
MTEAEWLASTDPEAMLRFLLGEPPPRPGGLLAWLGFTRVPGPEAPALGKQTSDRKLRLYACACCRRIGELLQDERSREALEVAELFADGLLGEEERQAAEAAAWDALGSILTDPALEAAQLLRRTDPTGMLLATGQVRHWRHAAQAAVEAVRGAAAAATDQVIRAAREEAMYSGLEWAVQAAGPAVRIRLLRDIVGNPFRPPAIRPAWLTWNDGTVPRLARVIYQERLFEDLPVLADALEEAGCDNADLLAHCRGGGEHVRGCWAVDCLLGKE